MSQNGGMFWKPDPLLYPSYLRSRIRRGRGIGEGPNYLPWLKVRDVPSQGTSLTGHGILTGRSHHGLSSLEATYLFLLERRSGVLDIREQWPILDIARTIELCTELGIRHNFRKGFPEPFTIDFLITEVRGDERSFRAASVKTPEDAADPAVRVRLAVEERWCSERGIPWTLVDTSHFSRTLLETLRFIRTWSRHRYEPSPAREAVFMEAFRKAYTRNELLSHLMARLSKGLRLPPTQTLDTFRYCVWSNEIEISFSHSVALNKPLVLK